MTLVVTFSHYWEQKKILSIYTKRNGLDLWEMFTYLTGIAGCLGAVAYGAYTYKNRGEMSTSVFLMKFRVIAQSMVVLTLGAGITYSMIDKYVLPKLAKTEAKEGNSSQ